MNCRIMWVGFIACLLAALAAGARAGDPPADDGPATDTHATEPVSLEGEALAAWLNAWMIPPYERTSGSLYCQDAMITTPTEGCIPATCFESKVQELNGNTGTNIKGSGNQQAADDFVVPAGQTWLVDEITFYAYQTYASYPDSTFTSARIVVWDGDPSAGSPNVLLDLTTTYPPQTSRFTKIFRSFDFSCVATKPIFDLPNPISPPLELAPGTYWVGFQAEGTEADGPTMPFVTTLGQAGTVTGQNAWHLQNGVWSAVNAGHAKQDVPFCVYGAVQAFAKGDLNCDGFVNSQDIDGFIYALFGLLDAYDAYLHSFPEYHSCDILNADFSADGVVNSQDIDGFIIALFQ